MFSQAVARVWAVEEEGAKLGQFPEAQLQGFTTSLKAMIQAGARCRDFHRTISALRAINSRQEIHDVPQRPAWSAGSTRCNAASDRVPLYRRPDG